MVYIYHFLLYHTKINKGTKTTFVLLALLVLLYHTKINKGTKTNLLICLKFVLLYHTKINKGANLTKKIVAFVCYYHTNSPEHKTLNMLSWTYGVWLLLVCVTFRLGTWTIIHIIAFNNKNIKPFE